MAVTVTEHFESRRMTIGRNPTADLKFIARGSNDHADIALALNGTVPLTFDLFGDGLVVLFRKEIRPEPIGDSLWFADVSYVSPHAEPAPAATTGKFRFDTTGGSQHITHSYGTQRYPSAGPNIATDCKGGIGVSSDQVAGVDITVPVYKFSETWTLPAAMITNAYKGVVFNATGKVNNANFRGFQEGECLFLGAQGAQEGSGDWEISFEFAASPNRDHGWITIGGIVVGAKRGWEYMWVRSKPGEDTAAKDIVPQPTGVYIEAVYEYTDFSLLGIGS